MTQKEAIKNILETIETPAFRKEFIYQWLKDINWHREAALFAEQTPEEQRALINEYQKLDYILNASGYSADFVYNWMDEHDVTYNDARVAHLSMSNYNGRLTLNIDGLDHYFSVSQARDFSVIREYKTINHIWGWGLDKSWQSNGQGQAFVNELWAMLAEFEPMDTERVRVANAYNCD